MCHTQRGIKEKGLFQLKQFTASHDIRMLQILWFHWACRAIAKMLDAIVRDELQHNEQFQDLHTKR